jgi:N-acetylglucosamine-6-phosphate deacetylase
MRLGVKAALVHGEIVKGDVAVEHGRVAAVGLTPEGPYGVAVPGFVDVQVNGFAGVDFLSADADGYARAGDALAATGVTAFVPTFVSAAIDTTRAALHTVASLQARRGPRILGAHLEGPFLSPQWAGAHDPQCLREPDIALADELCAAGPVSIVTLAPELPGGMELVAHLAAAGVAVSLGHSDADTATAHAAFELGARAVTHVHNAHRRFQPRDPGLAGVALVRPGVAVQLILDHVHLAPETSYAAFLAARQRFCLVTDAIAGAGLGDGTYRLGHRQVVVADGAARLHDGRLAGSVLTMDQAVRNLVGLGATLAQAVHCAARTPALLAGREDLGTLAEGGPADIAVLDDNMRVARTFVGGEEVFTADGAEDDLS